MTQPPRDDVRLFSYGTVQQRDVQLATFGHELTGRTDALPGYTRSTVAITDPAAIALSGSALHPIIAPTSDPADSVAGTVLDITRDELGAADESEVANYVRIETTLASGTTAWVYLGGRTITTRPSRRQLRRKAVSDKGSSSEVRRVDRIRRGQGPVGYLLAGDFRRIANSGAPHSGQ